MKYKTKEEAEKIATIENMGRDYSFAYVAKDGEYFVVKIKTY